MPATATLVGGGLGFAMQLYVNALRKLPLLRSKCQHPFSLTIVQNNPPPLPPPRLPIAPLPKRKGLVGRAWRVCVRGARQPRAVSPREQTRPCKGVVIVVLALMRPSLLLLGGVPFRVCFRHWGVFLCARVVQ